MKQKIAIIGAGAVGSTIAYALLLKDIAADIALIDVNEIRCRGEILDLSDALSFCGPSSIRVGDSHDAKEADIIIIAAGKRQKPGEDRLALLKANKDIIESVFKEITPLKKNSIVIMVTNPVDIMTYIAQQKSGLDKKQVIGSGTFLDTQRLRGLISQKIGIAEQSIHAYILGEHGDNQFPVWSCARVAGMALEQFGLTEKDFDLFAKQTKDKAYEIIACKGSTFYGIAMCVAALCRTILFDQKRVTPVSCYIERYEVCMSMPVVLGTNGIDEILELPLNQKEQRQLEIAAAALKKLI